MKCERFRGPKPALVLSAARAALGEDVHIIRTGHYEERGLSGFEVIATRAEDLDNLMRRLDDPMPAALHPGAAARSRPYILALVGPPGAGKTTTTAKLAVHPQVFGQKRVGLLSLDTFRAGAIEQLDNYAVVADLPIRVAFEPRDVEPALAWLADRGCEVVLIDTPGRSPLSHQQNAQWRALLAACTPDETHLVLPASLRADVARSQARSFAPHGVTHMLISKMDEVPTGDGIVDLVAELDLRARWIADGQDVPHDLRPARTGIPQSFGIEHEAAALV